jgi:signal transduction histidine kinase
MLVRESVALSLPSASFDATPMSEVRPGQLPTEDCLIVDASEDAAAAGELVQRLRAGGVRSAIVLLVAERDAALAQRVGGLGALEQVALASAPRGLGAAMEAALGSGDWSDRLEATRVELRRAQRLIAAGEVALGLQHAMNNPLTAVLAEAQLLGMEDLPEEQAAAVRRIVESTRRVVQLVRKLDVVATKESARQA